MGIETIALAALTTASVYSSVSAGQKQAKQIVAQGELAAREKAKEVRLRTSRAKVSFLSSGLSLEGTPLNALESMFNTGIEDINQIRSNANAGAKNAIASARSQALRSITSAFAMSSFDLGFSNSGMTSMKVPTGSGYGGAFGLPGSADLMKPAVNPFGVKF